MAFDIIVSANKSYQTHVLCLNTMSLVLWIIIFCILMYYFMCFDTRTSRIPKILKLSATFFVSGGCIQFIVKILIASYVIYYPLKYHNGMIYNPVHEDRDYERIINLFTTLAVSLLFISFYIFIISRLKLSFAGSAQIPANKYIYTLYIFAILASASITLFLVIQHLDLLENMFPKNVDNSYKEISCVGTLCYNNSYECNNQIQFCDVTCDSDNSCDSMQLYSNANDTVFYCGSANACNNIEFYCGYNENNNQNNTDYSINSCIVECNHINACNNIVLYCDDTNGANRIHDCAITGVEESEDKSVSEFAIQNSQIHCLLNSNNNSNVGCRYGCWTENMCSYNNTMYCNSTGTNIWEDFVCACEGESCGSIDMYYFGKLDTDEQNQNVFEMFNETDEYILEYEFEETYSDDENEEEESDHLDGFLICVSETACDLEKTFLWLFFIFDALIRICILYSFNSRLFRVIANTEMENSVTTFATRPTTSIINQQLMNAIIRQTLLVSLMVIANLLDFIFLLFINEKNRVYAEYTEFISNSIQIICFFLSFHAMKISSRLYVYICGVQHKACNCCFSYFTRIKIDNMIIEASVIDKRETDKATNVTLGPYDSEGPSINYDITPDGDHIDDDKL
eukprot:220648_1